MKKSIFVICLVLVYSLGYSQSNVFKAISKGDIDFVRSYIFQEKDLNVTFKATTIDEYSSKKISHLFDLIEYAAVQNQEEIVNLLIKSKDRINNFQASLNKAFAASISTGNTSVIKRLLENGAEINSVCVVCYGQTAIQTAIEYSNFSLVNFLIEKNADLNVRNIFGRTLLHSAAHTGNTDLAKSLIEKGLDVNAKDNDGATPLIYAASNGEYEMFKLLIEKGAEISIKENDGSDALLSAIQKGNSDIVNFLLDKCCDINQTNNNEDTPLIIAASASKPQITQIIIDRGADINQANSRGETALFFAITNKDTETAKLLIEKGADLTSIDYIKPAKKFIKDKSFIEYLKSKLEAQINKQ
ncbi:MAG: ankyrin repeat domain-containing protein [Tenuifilaceae bacterium]